MPHKLIVGTTMSGKSTLARAMVADAARRGIIPVIYDPHGSPEWDSEIITADESEFFTAVSESIGNGRKIFAVMDEAETVLSISHRHNWWMFTRARHYGIESCAITLRPKLIAPTVRGNVHEMFVFNLCRTDAQELADDFNAPGLADAPNLAQGEFLFARWVDKKKIVDKLKVF